MASATQVHGFRLVTIMLAVAELAAGKMKPRGKEPDLPDPHLMSPLALAWTMWFAIVIGGVALLPRDTDK